MDVHRSTAHRVEQPFRDLVSIGGPHERLRPQGEDGRILGWAEARGLNDRDAERARRRLDRGLAHDTAGAGAIGLGHHARQRNHTVEREPMQRFERGDRERRRPQEDDAGGYAETGSSSSGSTGWRSSRDFSRST